MTKNETTETTAVITDVEPQKASILSTVKKGAAKHSGKIKVVGAALAGAAAATALICLGSKPASLETEDEMENFAGNDEETVNIEVPSEN